jgi:hypothetical protein
MVAGLCRQAGSAVFPSVNLTNGNDLFYISLVKKALQKQRPARIVTYCHEGSDLIKGGTSKKERPDQLKAIAAALEDRPEWGPLDAVLLPGGFFAENPGKKAARFIERLETHSPGLHLVAGVDKDGMQLALAFNRDGLAGKARKLFPVGEDVAEGMIHYEADYDDPRRIICLENGQRALLCVCYDAFGFADTMRGKSGKLDKIVRLRDAKGILREGKDAKAALSRVFRAHSGFVKDAAPDLLLTTLHRFERPGREIFWQRHGIAAASAALKGGLAAAAAHSGILPEPEQMTLVSRGVPQSHLEAGMKRAAHMKAPAAHAYVEGPAGRGLLRLFV